MSWTRFAGYFIEIFDPCVDTFLYAKAIVDAADMEKLGSDTVKPL